MNEQYIVAEYRDSIHFVDMLNIDYAIMIISPSEWQINEAHITSHNNNQTRNL